MTAKQVVCAGFCERRRTVGLQMQQASGGSTGFVFSRALVCFFAECAIADRLSPLSVFMPPIFIFYMSVRRFIYRWKLVHKTQPPSKRKKKKHVPAMPDILSSTPRSTKQAVAAFCSFKSAARHLFPGSQVSRCPHLFSAMFHEAKANR